MKPAPFEYIAPESVAGALAALGEDAKALAGGQSLVPLLNFRLARPAMLVDLNALDELSFVRKSAGTLHIGALTRQATLLRSSVVERGWPLLRRAVAHVAHPAIRNRGTVGGSVAHADPAAELPVALTALDARFHVRSAHRGERTIAASDFFVAPLMTALEPDELLVEIEVPPLRDGARAGFVELGAGPTPLRVPDAERALCNGASAAEAAGIAGAELDDDYRRALTTELVRRAIEEAA
jgi:CO/xanthine dehydrogenase FAD-binding subunit